MKIYRAGLAEKPKSEANLVAAASFAEGGDAQKAEFAKLQDPSRVGDVIGPLPTFVNSQDTKRNIRILDFGNASGFELSTSRMGKEVIWKAKGNLRDFA